MQKSCIRKSHFCDSIAICTYSDVKAEQLAPVITVAHIHVCVCSIFTFAR